MKKVFLMVFAGVLCLTLAGCGSKSAALTEKAENIIEKAADQVDKMLDEGQSEVDKAESVKLYTDSTKLVYRQSDSYRIVFYFEGEKITGHEVYINYGTPEAAALAQASYQRTDGDLISEVSTNGAYVVVKYAEEEYANYTVSQIKLTYSYLESLHE